MESIRDDVTKDGKDSHIEMRRREGLQATCAGEFKKARAFEPDRPSSDASAEGREKSIDRSVLSVE